jgi:hypothetical protein
VVASGDESNEEKLFFSSSHTEQEVEEAFRGLDKWLTIHNKVTQFN